MNISRKKENRKKNRVVSPSSVSALSAAFSIDLCGEDLFT
jgi:hypothetical protein